MSPHFVAGSKLDEPECIIEPAAGELPSARVPSGTSEGSGGFHSRWNPLAPLHRRSHFDEIVPVRTALFWVCLLFAGCAAVEKQPAPVGPKGEAFYLTGRVSVKYGSEAASGRIAWQHDAASDDLLLSSPLGQGVAHIVRRNDVASLTTSDQKQYQANDVEALTEQVLGWRLPLAGLPDWVRGRAAAGTPAQGQLDDSQRLTQLRQSGWLVEFLDYGNGNGLPSRLRLSRQEVELRIVIDQWRDAP